MLLDFLETINEAAFLSRSLPRCSRFQEETELDVFLLSLTEVVCGLRENVSDEDEEGKLKEELFKSFTPAVQKSVLHKCAGNHVKVMLQVLSHRSCDHM